MHLAFYCPLLSDESFSLSLSLSFFKSFLCLVHVTWRSKKKKSSPADVSPENYAENMSIRTIDSSTPSIFGHEKEEIQKLGSPLPYQHVAAVRVGCAVHSIGRTIPIAVSLTTSYDKCPLCQRFVRIVRSFLPFSLRIGTLHFVVSFENGNRFV